MCSLRKTVMKGNWYVSIVPLMTAILFVTSLRARAAATAFSQISFGGTGTGFEIQPEGDLDYYTVVNYSNAPATVSAQAGPTIQCDSGNVPSASASDTYSMALSSASAPANYGNPGGFSGLSVMASSRSAIPGQLSASDQAKGTILIGNYDFSLTGYGAPSGYLSPVTLSLTLNYDLSLSTDAYGQSAEAGMNLSLNLSGGGYDNYPIYQGPLFSPLNIGPDDSQSMCGSFSYAARTLILQDDVSYQLSLEVDTETSVTNVPEPGISALTIVATVGGILFRRKRIASGRMA